MQEIQDMPVRSLGQEDPLEEEMATHSSILAWEIPWAEEPGGLQSMGFSPWSLKKRDTTEYARLPSGPRELPAVFSFLYQMPTIPRPPFWAQLQKLFSEFSDFFFQIFCRISSSPILHHHYLPPLLGHYSFMLLIVLHFFL